MVFLGILFVGYRILAVWHKMVTNNWFKIHSTLQNFCNTHATCLTLLWHIKDLTRTTSKLGRNIRWGILLSKTIQVIQIMSNLNLCYPQWFKLLKAKLFLKAILKVSNILVSEFRRSDLSTVGVPNVTNCVIAITLTLVI